MIIFVFHSKVVSDYIFMDFSTLFTPLNITLGTLVVAAFFFMQGKIRADLVAICSLVVLLLTGVLDVPEALSGFSNSVIIMMIGLFVVGAGIFRTGLAKMVSSKIIGLAGTNENLLLVLVMLVTACVGAFVSNTGTVAVMMPIVMSMAASSNISARRYLMPLAFASSMGMFTLISTPPNLVINEELIKSDYQALSFFSFAPIGLLSLLVGVVVLFFLSRILDDKKDANSSAKKKGKSLEELVEEYNLQQQSFSVFVPKGSSIIGQSLAELNLTNRYNISISKIVTTVKKSRFSKKVVEEVAGPKSVVMEESILHCQGQEEDIENFIKEYSLLHDNDERKEAHNFQESGIAEAYVLPNSGLINKTIYDSKFRERYGVNILGIKRSKEYRMSRIQDIKIHEGDAILIQGTWEKIAELDDSFNDLVMVGQPLKEASKVTLDQKAPIAAGIMLLMVIAMVLDIVPPVAAVMTAAIAIIMTGCLRNMEEAYDSINWGSILLIAAMMPMATAFEKTGVTRIISDGLIEYFGGMGPYALLAGVYLCTSMLTMVMSNTATAVLFAPIAMTAAKGMEVSPYPFLFAVAVAASMCFASPFSTPPNAMVMNAGQYSFMDYIRVGLPLQVIMGIVMVIALPFMFPF